MNQALGTYVIESLHTIYTINHIRRSDYHYHNYFDDTKHTDGNMPLPIVDTPVDFDNKGVSDYPESRVSVMATTQFIHNEDTGAFGIDVEQDGITEAARGITNCYSIEAGTRLRDDNQRSIILRTR